MAYQIEVTTIDSKRAVVFEADASVAIATALAEAVRPEIAQVVVTDLVTGQQILTYYLTRPT